MVRHIALDSALVFLRPAQLCHSSSGQEWKHADKSIYSRSVLEYHF